jgi:MoaA/NifB/PqqE/SkfB family radical SAM enzyme
MSNIMHKTTKAVRSYRDMMMEKPAPNRIKRMLIAVNGWCNSKCTFCNIWKYDKALALREEITLEELERNLFSAEALKDVLNIGITGGEPFLRRDIVELCNAMFRHFPHAHIGVVTNSIRYERVVDAAKRIAAANPGREFSIAISLDGYADTHDRVRGVPGNFERILKAVALLKEEAPSVLVGFSHTVTPDSMQDSLRCYELSRELGIGFMYRLAHDAPYLRNEGDEIWSPETLQRVRPIVEELNRRMLHDQGAGAKLGNTSYAQVAFYHQMMDYMENPRRTCECYSGTHSFLLAHDGTVHPCVTLPDAMGNVREQHFDDIWYSAQAERVRQPIAEWKCHCWTNCETEFSLARQPGSFGYSLGKNWGALLPGGNGAASRTVIPLEPQPPAAESSEEAPAAPPVPEIIPLEPAVAAGEHAPHEHEQRSTPQ